jgi:hypothetical protein
MSACKTFSHQQVHQLLDEVLGPGLHAKRIASLADATLGVMHTPSLAVCTIGNRQAMASRRYRNGWEGVRPRGPSAILRQHGDRPRPGDTQSLLRHPTSHSHPLQRMLISQRNMSLRATRLVTGY